jgi:hypothetical protein
MPISKIILKKYKKIILIHFLTSNTLKRDQIPLLQNNQPAGKQAKEKKKRGQQQELQ